MIIEFDAAKNAKNILERELSFERAQAFDWSTANIDEDVRQDYPERRFVAAGYLDGRLHMLCFTPINGGIRVISFRKANPREARKHDKSISFD
ncbi:MAG: BrnT family toxin [Methylococcaceae bacterium]|nr:BrnT family toxin [Methylococcaceae bacterium]MDZ4156086.1 BrnT family toxin [Methylococcales bacterium]MDP2395095.1 BrnT family toxin [Methylococcaceae bacterium]MDP3018763.1 BrnT family toxin [Methylococcaceae bacterium]MDP3390520.1 BrnT family toxin [Methylococcaceae bacterium]